MTDRQRVDLAGSWWPMPGAPHWRCRITGERYEAVHESGETVQTENGWMLAVLVRTVTIGISLRERGLR